MLGAKIGTAANKPARRRNHLKREDSYPKVQSIPIRSKTVFGGTYALKLQ